MTGAAQGSYAIGWDQVSVDGVVGAALGLCRAGRSFRWRGAALRLDGPQAVLALGMTAAAAELRQRARRAAGRLLSAALPIPAEPEVFLGGPSITVTDGLRDWRVDLVEGHRGQPRLAHFPHHPPPPQTDLWISQAESVDAVPEPVSGTALVEGMIAGTGVATPRGPVPVERLQPGAEVVTADWRLARVTAVVESRITGARLCAIRAARPVRVAAGALGAGVPAAGLVVGPDQQIVIDGPDVRVLFPCGPVVVAARDLDGCPGLGRVEGLPVARLFVLELDRPACVMAEGVAVVTGAGQALRRIGKGEAAILLSAMARRAS